MRRRIGGPTFQPSAGKQSVSARTHPVVPLQRAIGNRATTQLLRRGAGQAPSLRDKAFQAPSQASAKSSSPSPPQSGSGQSFTVKIKGSKQGQFSGGMGGRIAGRKYHFGASSATDSATGHATGKTQYQAITFHKAMDSASPQLLQALTTNEVLTDVTFEFNKTTSSGESQIFEVVKLTNARLTAVDQDMDTGAEGDETVSLVFEKIEMDDQTKGTAVADDWHK